MKTAGDSVGQGKKLFLGLVELGLNPLSHNE